MTRDRTFVIVGAGLAAAKAVEQLRESGYGGRLVLIGAEEHPPYHRPPLSKGYLRGEDDESTISVHEPGFYDSQEVECHLGRRAVSLDPAAGELTLDGGERMRYDRLLLATGAEPRRLPVPGEDLEDVHYLRSVTDSTALRERLQPGGRIVIVGAGWIGCEVAASARQRGLDVTVIDPLSTPIESVLGSQIGAVYRDIHADHGVRMLLGSGVRRLEGDSRVEGVRLDNGRLLDCDLVAVGVGVTPRVGLAERAGLAVDDGITVDERLRTEAPGVFAAGDVAKAHHPLYGQPLRVEHWDNAMSQGSAAALNMLDAGGLYRRVPYFFSDQYDVGMEYTGFAPHWDRVVLRGSVDEREFIAFWMAGNRVVAGMNVNLWGVSDTIRRLVGTGTPVSDRDLEDADVPLDELAPEG